MAAPRPIDPRLRVAYLVAVAVGVILLKQHWQLGAVVGVELALWLFVGLGFRRLVRQVVKLWGFAAFILVSYAVTDEDPRTDDWVSFSVFGHELSLNVGGALVGGLMILRVLAVVLASQIARAGDGRAVAAGLAKLRVPAVVAQSIDAVLALLGGGGGGGGGGRGRQRHVEGEEKIGFWAALKRLWRGDMTPIVRRLERQIARAEDHVEEGQGAANPTPAARAVVNDVPIIAGVALTMLGIKALKVLPSIPFAPGHKLVLLTPLYVVARMLTKSRFGATLTGLTMGSVAFLLGDGRYGIFEVVKHVAPGIVCDLAVPMMTRGGRRPGPVAWSVLGGVIGAARFATIFVVTLTVQAPAVAYAFLIPGLAIHTTFGALSGYVSERLVRALDAARKGVHESVTTEAGAGSADESGAILPDEPIASAARPKKDEGGAAPALPHDPPSSQGPGTNQ